MCTLARVAVTCSREVCSMRAAGLASAPATVTGAEQSCGLLQFLAAMCTVLCSYFAQRMGTKNNGWGQKSDGEEIFQGLERFE